MENRVVNFLTGAILGAVVGAALAVLLAPMSGEELQGQLRNRASDLQIDVKRAAADRRAELEAQLAHLRSG